MQLVFNITDIPSKEVIRKCELRIFRKKPENLPEAEKKQSHLNKIIVRSSGIKKTINNKLLSSNESGWIQFDVTSAVKDAVHLKSLRKNILLKLSVEQAQSKQLEHKLELALSEKDIEEPILVVYTDSKQTLESTPSVRKTADVSLETYLTQIKATSTRKREARTIKESDNCHRENMLVDLKEMGWHKLFVKPLNFNAYRCRGTCSATPSKNKSNHAIIQAHISELSEEAKVDAPCCSPRELEPMDFLIIEKKTPKTIITLKSFSDVVVKSCGCT